MSSNSWICTRVRENVRDVLTVEKVFPLCTWFDVQEVLSGWAVISSNYKAFSKKLIETFFNEHPLIKSFFPACAQLAEDEIVMDQSLLTHTYYLLKGLNTAMINLSGFYEGENEILPLLAKTHMKRGVTFQAMTELKEALYTTSCDFLKLPKKQKNAWKNVLQYIFDTYILHFYADYKKLSILTRDTTDRSAGNASHH